MDKSVFLCNLSVLLWVSETLDDGRYKDILIRLLKIDI